MGITQIWKSWFCEKMSKVDKTKNLHKEEENLTLVCLKMFQEIQREGDISYLFYEARLGHNIIKRKLQTNFLDELYIENS